MREELESLVAIHNPTHRGLDWLLRGVLPAHDYTVVIRQARRPPGETPTHRGNRWPDPLPGPPTNDQEMLLQEADTQRLIETILDAFLPQVNWSRVELCTQKEGEHPKAFIEWFMQTLQRHKALNLEAPEHRNLLITVLVGNFLPDRKKKQIQNSVFGWSGQPLSVIMEPAM